MEHQIILPDGQMRWVHARASAIRDASGQVYRLAGIVEDITARKSTEDQLRQAQKMEVIGQLAGGVAHDFNNLLTIIGGNVELLLADSEHLSAEAKDYLNDIANAALRAETLTRQLLSFSRRGAMHMQVLNLNDLIAAFTKLLRRMLGESVVILNEFGKDLPAIEADPGMIEQILMNLAVNARDAMPSGGQLVIRTETRTVNTAEAQLRRRAGGVYVCLTVSDAGGGILPEHMARIFEPFFTTKRAGKGTGLGLTTVFGIVEQHKGWVEVSSQVGKGTVFRVFLPATTGKVADANVPAQEETAGGGEKILVTEDDAALRGVVAEILQKRGYAVFEAESGVEAQQRWLGRSGEIDLLVADMITTGGVTGMELAEKLRLENPGLKVILISGYSAELPSSDVAMKKNMIVLKKPFAPQELADTVRRCLDG
jgi:signal transduction histidine kinase/CheY-like chemotaxis protein